MDRLTELEERIRHFETYYHRPQVPGGLCRTANITQLAAYNSWVQERNSLLGNVTYNDLHDKK
jgi:hypothetical protein